MLANEETLRRILGGEGELVVESEAPGRERASIAGGQDALVIRRHPEDECAANHAAVVEALASAGFRQAPKVVALDEFATIEHEFAGLPLLAVEARASVLDQCVDAMVALHSVATQEGLRWGMTPAETLPNPGVPLHRLGFTSAEREPAEPWFEVANEALAATPFGFTHGGIRANNLLVGSADVALVNFDQAGFGSRYVDLGALLATAGLDGAERRRLARRYASATGGDADAAEDLVDLATLVWGVQDLLELPRRQILVMGDDAAMNGLLLMASRTERALREPAGNHPAAVAIRMTLWPRND